MNSHYRVQNSSLFNVRVRTRTLNLQIANRGETSLGANLSAAPPIVR